MGWEKNHLDSCVRPGVCEALSSSVYVSPSCSKGFLARLLLNLLRSAGEPRGRRPRELRRLLPLLPQTHGTCTRFSVSTILLLLTHGRIILMGFSGRKRVDWRCGGGCVLAWLPFFPGRPEVWIGGTQFTSRRSLSLPSFSRHPEYECVCACFRPTYSGVCPRFVVLHLSVCTFVYSMKYVCEVRFYTTCE